MPAPCFNPRAPCGAQRMYFHWSGVILWFQSTRPMRGATPAESTIREHLSVSIHAPHAGRDEMRGELQKRINEFQSTRPMRGATLRSDRCPLPKRFQSTRPMRGATASASKMFGVPVVSIHAPHAGRDDVLINIGMTVAVSIHAPHAGRDVGSRFFGYFHRCFNPRAPCGARQRGWLDFKAGTKFQSTRPMRGATCRQFRQDEIRVSIHAPHAGRDFSYLVCAIV